MTVKEAVEKRRSIRKFTGTPVTRDQLIDLIEVARLCPSSINSQPWRFRPVTDPATIAWFSGEATSKQTWLAGAGGVIVCCVDAGAYMRDSRAILHAMRDAGMITTEFSDQVDTLYLDPIASGPPAMLRAAAAFNLAIAMSAMTLRAVEMGLGTTWVGRVEEDMVKQKLALPAHLAVIALLAVGWPAEQPDQRPRKGLDEILV